MTRQEMEKLLAGGTGKETVDALLNAMHAEIKTHKDAAAAAQAEAQARAKELAEAAAGAAGARELQARLEALQARYDADVEAARQRAADAEFGALVDGAIRERRGRSVKAIRALLDLDALRASEHPREDAAAAVAALAEGPDAYLFEDGRPAPTGEIRNIGGNAGGPPAGDEDARMRAAIGLRP